MKVLKRWMLILFFIFSGSSTYAWWDYGHMVVAEIARLKLPPEKVKKAEEILQFFQIDFLQAATWADVLKEEGMETTSPWHFDNLVYDPDSILSEEKEKVERAKSTYGGVNYALRESIETLKSPKSTAFTRAFSLVWIIHLVGDIHQPLHISSRYTKFFPEGDMGGNKFTIKGMEGVKNLHSLWDSVGGLMSKKPSTEEVEKMAHQLLEENPEMKTGDHQLSSWMEECYHLLPEVYSGVEFNSTPSNEYVEKVQHMAKHQVLLAGLRLAQILEESL